MFAGEWGWFSGVEAHGEEDVFDVLDFLADVGQGALVGGLAHGDKEGVSKFLGLGLLVCGISMVE